MSQSFRILGLLVAAGAVAAIPASHERVARAQQPRPAKWGLVKVTVNAKDSTDIANNGHEKTEWTYTPTSYVYRNRWTEDDGKVSRDRHFQHTFSVPPRELVEGQTFDVTVTGKTLSGGPDRFIGVNASAGGSDGLDFQETITLDGKPRNENLFRCTYLGNFNDFAWEVKNSVASYRVTVTPKLKAKRQVFIAFYSGTPILGSPMVTYEYELGAKPIDGPGGTGPGPDSPAANGNLEGTWKNDSGGEMKITKQGELYSGTYTKVPPALGSLFKAGDLSFRNAKKTGPNTFQGEVLLRYSGGREEWRPTTIKIDGDKLTFQFDQTNVATALTVWTRTSPSGSTGNDGCPGTFAGEWGDWGANVGARRGTPPTGTEGTWGKWTFQENGNTVTGSVPNMAGKYGPATINGTANGRTLTATWKTASASGTLTVSRTPDNCTFSGTYTVDAPPGQPGGTYGPPTGSTQTIPTEGMVLLAPLDLKVAKGSRVLVPIQLIRAKDVRNMKFELTYLPEVVTGINDVTPGNLLTALSKANLNKPGLFTVDFAQDQLSPLNGNGIVANFRFDAIGQPRSSTPLKLAVNRVDDSNRKSLPISVVNGSITIYDPNDKTDPNNPGWTGGRGTGTEPRLQPTCSGTGRQTMADAICCLEVSVGLKGPLQAYLQMDLNQDGKVDSGDAVIIMDNLARGAN